MSEWVELGWTEVPGCSDRNLHKPTEKIDTSRDGSASKVRPNQVFHFSRWEASDRPSKQDDCLDDDSIVSVVRSSSHSDDSKCSERSEIHPTRRNVVILFGGDLQSSEATMRVSETLDEFWPYTLEECARVMSKRFGSVAIDEHNRAHDILVVKPSEMISSAAQTALFHNFLPILDKYGQSTATRFEVLVCLRIRDILTHFDLLPHHVSSHLQWTLHLTLVGFSRGANVISQLIHELSQHQALMPLREKDRSSLVERLRKTARLERASDLIVQPRTVSLSSQLAASATVCHSDRSKFLGHSVSMDGVTAVGVIFDCLNGLYLLDPGNGSGGRSVSSVPTDQFVITDFVKLLCNVNRTHTGREYGLITEQHKEEEDEKQKESECLCKDFEVNCVGSSYQWSDPFQRSECESLVRELNRAFWKHHPLAPELAKCSKLADYALDNDIAQTFGVKSVVVLQSVFCSSCSVHYPSLLRHFHTLRIY